MRLDPTPCTGEVVGVLSGCGLTREVSSFFNLPSSRQLSQAIHAENKPGYKPQNAAVGPLRNQWWRSEYVDKPTEHQKRHLSTFDLFGVSTSIDWRNYGRSRRFTKVF